VGDRLRNDLEEIYIFQVTSFTEKLLTCPCQPFSNILPGLFPEMLYTHRHSWKKRTVSKVLVKVWQRKREEDEGIGESVCTMEKRGREG
jgi:hypothetical protein